MNLNPEMFNEVIQKRRSVFQAQYSGERVDDAIITQMLQNANCAPTHKLTEPWRFVVFTGAGLKRLGDFQARLYKEVTMADGSYRENRYQNLLTKPMLSSHIVAVCMRRDEKESLPIVEEIGAVFCAIENMYLTATAYGIGAYLSTGGITYFEEAKEFFGLSGADQLLGFLHVGMPKGALPDRKRTPVEDKVRWER